MTRRMARRSAYSLIFIFFTGSITAYNELVEAIVQNKSYATVLKIIRSRHSGTNTPCQTTKQITPLLAAVSHDRPDLVMLLIQRGANPLIKDAYDQTALHHIAHRTWQQQDVSWWLEFTTWCINKGVALQARDIDNQTALSIAVEKGNLDLFNLLLEHGADVTTLHVKNRNLLHLAAYFFPKELPEINNPYAAMAQFNRLQCMRTLLECGVNHYAQDADGNTPFFYANDNTKNTAARNLLLLAKTYRPQLLIDE